MDRKSLFHTSSILLLLLGVTNLHAGPIPLTDVEMLGEHLFFDTNLSSPAGQSCASCHRPDSGYADKEWPPVSEGVISGRFGNRNAPSIAYATYSPEFTLKQGVRGGQFRDGRASNLIEQAKQPFLDPLKMNNTSRGEVIGKIQNSIYTSLFNAICGPNAFAIENIDTTYECMAASIAAYESSTEVNKFESKFDWVMAGITQFTPSEKLGYKLFTGKANCVECHSAKRSKSTPALFTDFRYHNIGIPQNINYPFFLQYPIPLDLGLGGFLNDPKYNGKFKTPSLRNLMFTKPYMHNGVFDTLKQVVHFYNTRDVENNYPYTSPDFSKNMERKIIGNLKLTEEEEDALVTFLGTLSDLLDPPCRIDCAGSFPP